MLGVPRDAAETDVQHAFLRLARRVHPDTLPDADDAERRIAAARFDALVQARAVLLTPGSSEPPMPGAAGFAPRPSDPDGPRFRPVPGRGLGGSLVVLALLAFLLVALVTFEDSFRTESFEPVGGSSTGAPAPGR